MDTREIEKGIELFYAFLRKNPTLCPHTYVESSRHSKPLEDYCCKYRMTRILRNCEYCGFSKIEYILVDSETGEELDTSSLSLSTLADFFNGLNSTFDEQLALYYFTAARAQVEPLIAQYEEIKKEKEEEEEEKELYRKAYEKVGPIFTQFN